MTNESHQPGFFDNVEASAVWTFLGVVLLFSTAIGVVLIAPRFIDSSWIAPASYYQVQMYEVADPHFYISSIYKGATQLELVHHLKQDYSLLAFKESRNVRIIAPKELDEYVTRYEEPVTKLTSRLLFLRTPQPNTENGFDAYAEAEKLRKQLQKEQNKDHVIIDYDFYELYDPQLKEAFSLAAGDGLFENFVSSNFIILDGPKQPFHSDPGVVYVNNPIEYRVREFNSEGRQTMSYSPHGRPVKDLAELTSENLGFMSRKELIALGEQIYAHEGCFYCHTDQTRTLVQDTILNGSDSFPAPPSSPNEYIYQQVTFPGTRRIGPDLSRVGIKRPSRDWHKSHFWAPRTESPGTIMPAFKHFFDDSPAGGAVSTVGIPNYRFEAIFQYLMTKGTRITPPSQAWWLGKDPVQTLEIIEGRKVIAP